MVTVAEVSSPVLYLIITSRWVMENPHIGCAFDSLSTTALVTAWSGTSCKPALTGHQRGDGKRKSVPTHPEIGATTTCRQVRADTRQKAFSQAAPSGDIRTRRYLHPLTLPILAP